MYKLICVCLIGVVFFSFLSCSEEKVTLETKHLRIGIDKTGNITSFFDKNKSKEYFPSGQKSPILALSKDSIYLNPVSFSFDQNSGKFSLKYSNGSIATIRISINQDYFRFELVSVEPRNGIEAVVWGPYPTTIDEKIGETIGVVRDKDYAVGVQGLNIKTIEGLPYGDNAGGFFIEPLPGQQVPDSVKDMIGEKIDVNVNVSGDMPDYVRLYRGTTAIKTKSGSEIRLFSRDYRIPRVIPVWEGEAKYKQYVEPVDVDFVGSAIALFGCPEAMTLDVIEKIELGEGLPHPELNGIWIKRSKVPGQAYLLNEGDPYRSIKYAKECGFKLIHVGDFFQSWGHFGLKTKRFPNGVEDIKKATSIARNEGISLGVHTLTMFTTTNDSYVSPIPSDSLCKTGTSSIVVDLKKDDKEIIIENPTYFLHLGYTHTVKIGKELINYRAVSSEKPWRLIDCQRGVFGTTAGEYSKGTKIDKLTNNCYNGFYPDIHLQEKYAKRMADVCNETGIDLMDFDGYPHGASSPTGHDHYGGGLFIETWYKNLDRYRLTCGAGTFHYYWHIYAFMNWGEPWYNALRESQVNYRIENQRYFDRNLMPGMLGWFSLNPEFRPEEVEWIQARSAGFNAGYLLRVDESIEKNGYRDQIFELIREWQKARNQNAFSAKQIEELKNPKNEFHLEKKSENAWNLYPVKLFRGFEYKFRNTQTGEPVTNKFSISNPYFEQPLKFYLSLAPVNGNKTATISNLQIKLNNYQSVSIKRPLKAGDRIVCDGKSVYLCDFYWKKLEGISLGIIPGCTNGENIIEVTSDFSGDQAPIARFEFKTIGEPETVGNFPR